MGQKEEDTLIQENIQEFVYDDNKIVTCKWLSLTLSIPVNSAKQALFEFVDKARNEGNNDDVNVSYFVSGFDTKECGMKILKCIVVPESHLDSVKQTLDPLTSCHVYSVQKAQLKDYTPLYQADYDICKENIQALSKFSSITCPWAVRRDNQAGGTHREDATTQKSIDKGSTESKSTTAESTASNVSSKTNSKKVDNKKGGIASMFAAAEKKKSEKTATAANAKDGSSKTAAPKAKESTEKKGMESFLKGQAAGSKVKKETSPNLKMEEPKTNKTKSKSSDSKPDKSQKHKLPDKEEPQRKKRRRIRNDLFDSSDEEKNKSDDDDDNHDVNIEESEDEESKPLPSSDHEDEEVGTEACEEEDRQEPEKEKEKSPKKEGEKKTAGDVSTGGKKRKRTRKLVPRQHIDEDGFMVTEKVWESDSTDATDDEEMSKPKKAASPVKTNVSKPAPQNKKKPAVSPSKNKQTSLMSFFKKK